ncbi:MAG: hypothetical protein AAGE18_09955 [Pseudomonadota bacterium]
MRAVQNLGVLALALGLANPALAETGMGSRLLQGFEAADRDNDGRVTRAEVAAQAEARFAAADSDGDGRVAEHELAAAIEERLRASVEDRAAALAARMLRRGDDNDDGALDPAELSAARGFSSARWFDLADADDDGAVTRAELSELQEDLAERRDRRWRRRD